MTLTRYELITSISSIGALLIIAMLQTLLYYKSKVHPLLYFLFIILDYIITIAAVGFIIRYRDCSNPNIDNDGLSTQPMIETPPVESSPIDV